MHQCESYFTSSGTRFCEIRPFWSKFKQTLAIYSWTIKNRPMDPYKYCFYCSATHVTSQGLKSKSVNKWYRGPHTFNSVHLAQLAIVRSADWKVVTGDVGERRGEDDCEDDEEDGDALPRALGAAQVLLEPRRTRVASSAPRLHEVVPHGEEGRIGWRVLKGASEIGCQVSTLVWLIIVAYLVKEVRSLHVRRLW